MALSANQKEEITTLLQTKIENKLKRYLRESSFDIESDDVDNAIGRAQRRAV